MATNLDSDTPVPRLTYKNENGVVVTLTPIQARCPLVEWKIEIAVTLQALETLGGAGVRETVKKLTAELLDSAWSEGVK